MAALKNHPGMWLRDDAAAAINALEDKYGVIVINSAGRTVADQQKIIDDYDNGVPGIYMPYRPAEGSPHVRNGGIAVDIFNYTDDRAKMEEFGFKWAYGMDDPVHYDYIGWDGGNVITQPNQRKADSDGVRARKAPNTQAEVVDASFLAPNEVGTFAGYVIGETVNGLNVWLKGAYSGLFFWIGGFTDKSLNGLNRLDTPAPSLQPNQRRADSDGVRGRSEPSTKGTQVSFLEPGEVGDFNGWKHGESINGEDRWLRGAWTGAWFWLGGLTPRDVGGLTDLNGVVTPVPEDPSKSRTPVLPFANFGYSVPLGHVARKNGKITGLAIHHTTTMTSQVGYFKTDNSRGSCPTWQVMGKNIDEMIDPAMAPSSTGSAVNEYTVAIETVNISGEPDWKVSDDSIESIIRIGVWLVEKSRSSNPYLTDEKGKKILVDVKPDRDHIKGDKEYPDVRATRCPGEFLMSKMDYIVSEIARRSATTNPDPKPEPTPGLTPEATSFFQGLFSWLKNFFTK